MALRTDLDQSHVMFGRHYSREEIGHDTPEERNVVGQEFGNVRVGQRLDQNVRFFLLVDITNGAVWPENEK